MAKKKKKKKAKRQMGKEEMLLRKLFGEDYKKYRELAHKRIKADILSIEHAIITPSRFAMLPDLSIAENVMDDMFRNKPETGEIMKNVIRDLHGIIHNDETNKTGMHPEEFHGETRLYDVIWTHETGDREYSIDLVESFDSKEAAEAKMAELNSDEYEIVERDPDEYWAVLNADNKEMWKVHFPTLTRALAFLLYRAKPESVEKLLELYRETAKKKESEKAESPSANE